MKLILPLGGNSTRYDLERPKWLLTLPSGRLMIEEAVSGVNTANIESVVIIVIKGKFEKYISSQLLTKLISDVANCPAEVVVLDDPTKHQPETVYKGLSKVQGEFPFIVKDCDNYFEYTPSPGNGVCYVDLNDIEKVTARNKSFISFNKLGFIEKIIEKKVISASFCVGGYNFDSKKTFMSAYDAIVGEIKDMYLSHLIFHMIASGEVFTALPVSNYIDWGTIKEYRDFQSGAATLLLDFDGVLVENSSKFSKNPWSYSPISGNISFLREFLKKSPNSVVIITTSRPSCERSNIIKFLSDHEIEVMSVVTDLPHCKRILVNDFSSTNSYPSSIAISVPRNLGNLEDYLANVLN